VAVAPDQVIWQGDSSGGGGDVSLDPNATYKIVFTLPLALPAWFVSTLDGLLTQAMTAVSLTYLGTTYDGQYTLVIRFATGAAS
jgi:hypothetical protein